MILASMEILLVVVVQVFVTAGGFVPAGGHRRGGPGL